MPDSGVPGPPPADPSGSARAHRLGLWASLVLTTGIALPRIFTTNLSVDEAYSMDTASRSLAGTLHQAIHFELQPPLYFLLLNLWLRLWRSPEFARLLSLGCVLLALVMLHRLARRLGSTWGLAILPLLAALTAPVAWSAVTARGYGLTLLLLVTCAYGFAGLWCGDRPASRWDLPTFVVAGGAAIHTFYYSGFAVAGLVVAAALSGRHRRELAFAVVLLCLMVLPALPTVRMQLLAHPHPTLQGEVAAGKRWTVAPLQLLLGGMFWTGMLRRATGILALALGLGFAGVARVADGPPRWSRSETVWLVAALVSWGLLLVLDLTHIAWVLPRHRLVGVAGTVILLAVVLDRIRDRRRRHLAVTGALLVFGLFFASFELNLKEIESDWRAAARLISAQESTGEPVLLYTSDGLLPFRWEYHGSNRLHGVPADPDLERYDPADRYLRDTAQVRARVTSIVTAGQSFWLVRRQSPYKLAGGALLNAYLDRETMTLGLWQMNGVDVLHLRLHGR